MRFTEKTQKLVPLHVGHCNTGTYISYVVHYNTGTCIIICKSL